MVRAHVIAGLDAMDSAITILDQGEHGAALGQRAHHRQASDGVLLQKLLDPVEVGYDLRQALLALHPLDDHGRLEWAALVAGLVCEGRHLLESRQGLDGRRGPCVDFSHELAQILELVAAPTTAQRAGKQHDDRAFC